MTLEGRGVTAAAIITVGVLEFTVNTVRPETCSDLDMGYNVSMTATVKRADAVAAAEVYVRLYAEHRAMSRQVDAVKATLRTWFDGHPRQQVLAGVAALRGERTAYVQDLLVSALGPRAEECRQTVPTLRLMPVGGVPTVDDTPTEPA